LIPDPVSALALKSLGFLAGPLTRRVIERGAEKVLGPPERRALEKVRGTAVRETAEHLLGVCPDPARKKRDLVRLVHLLDQCIDQGLYLKESTVGQLLLLEETRRSLTSEFQRLDWTDYQVDDLEVLFWLEHYWERALEAAARQNQSPLHGTFIITLLQEERRARDTDAQQGLRPASIGFRKAFAEEVRPVVMAGVGWRKTLASLHSSYIPLRFWGHVWPVHVFPAQTRLWTDKLEPDTQTRVVSGLESAKGELVSTFAPTPSEYSPEFDPDAESVFRWHDGRRIERGHFPGVCYVLDRVSVSSDGDVLISSRVGRYFQSLATSEYLDDELVCALALRPNDAVSRDRLPRRSWLLNAVADPVLDGHRRAAAISVAAATILPDADRGGYRVLLPPRSGEVAAHRFFNHVVPAGIFQPLNDSEPDNSKEYSIRNVLLREFIEELHDREEFEQSMSRVWTDVEADPEWKRMAARLRNHQVSIHFTGVSVNLFTLRPEICCLILFRDTRVATEWTLNWENVGRHQVRLPDGRSVRRLLHLDAEFNPDDPAARHSISPANTVPNAAAALALGIRVAREVSG